MNLIGEVGESAIQVVNLPGDGGSWWDYYPSLGGSTAPTPTPIRVRPYPGFEEADLAETALPRPDHITSRDWPVAFHGVLAGPGDVDAFAIKARAGEVIQVEAFGERIGSPIDSIVEVYDPEGDLIARNDDDACHDSRIVFKAGSEGNYRIEVSDKRRQGGSAFLYRVEVEQPRPSLGLFLPGPIRKSQARQVIAVPRGNRVTAHIGVRRDGFDAPVQIETSGLPSGVSLDLKDIPSGIYLTPVVIEAAADAPLGSALVTVKGMANTPGGTVLGGFEQTVDLIQDSGDASYQSVTVDQLAVVVTEEAPYRVNLSEPKASLALDGAIEVVATVERAKGFEDSIEVSLPYLPPGVEMEGPIVLSPTESTAVFRLVARFGRRPRLVEAGRRDCQLRAPPKRDRREMTMALQNTIDPTANGGGGGRRRRAPVEGTPQVASKFVPIELSPSSISGDFDRSAVEQGKTVVVACALELTSPLPGSMTASLEGLPPRASSKPVEVKPGQRRVEFPVTVSATTPIGEHDSLLCRLTGEVGGQVVVYQVARGGVLKVVAPGALAVDARGKALSPLEALRRKELGAVEAEALRSTSTDRIASSSRVHSLMNILRPKSSRAAALAWLGPALFPPPAGRAEGPTASTRLIGVRVVPPAVELSTARDRQSIVVQAEYDDGSTRDVTAEARATVEPPVATVTDGIVAPKVDGQGRLKVDFEGLKAEVPVTVRKPSTVEPLRFRDDVVSIFTKAGCNTGKCHGSALPGKDGFRLSLFGYDPEGDHARLTRAEVIGRRVNLASPEDCLLLNKATGKVAHTGGKRIEPGGEGYQIVLRWLEAGAPGDTKEAAFPGRRSRSCRQAGPSSARRPRPSASSSAPASPMGPTGTSPGSRFS